MLHNADINVPEKSFRLFVQRMYLQSVISWRQYFVIKCRHFDTATAVSVANYQQQQHSATEWRNMMYNISNMWVPSTLLPAAANKTTADDGTRLEKTSCVKPLRILLITSVSKSGLADVTFTNSHEMKSVRLDLVINFRPRGLNFVHWLLLIIYSVLQKQKTQKCHRKGTQ